ERTEKRVVADLEWNTKLSCKYKIKRTETLFDEGGSIISSFFLSFFKKNKQTKSKYACQKENWKGTSLIITCQKETRGSSSSDPEELNPRPCKAIQG
ncbi:LOW QUALITY PROTEIN: hypothetical protein TorRG33x02_109020, partial [Trema orientale]